MKKQLTLIMLMLMSHAIYSQNIEKEILEYTEPKSTLINNGRNFVLDHLVAGDYNKATRAYVFLNDSVGDTNYNIFSFQEQVFLAVYTHQYKYALEAILNKKQIEIPMGLFIRDPAESFFTNRTLEDFLASKIASNLSEYKNGIENSELTFEQKNTIILTLKKLLLENRFLVSLDSDINQETLNEESTQFLNDFPNSIYSNYIRNFVRYEYVYERGLGIDFGLGTTFLTGLLRENFQPSVNFTFGLEGILKKHTLYLRASLISAKNTYEITNTPFLLPILENTPITFAVGELSYGYNIINGEKMSVTPFAGITLFEQSFSDKFTKTNPEYEQYHKDHFAYTAGINFDLNIIKDANYDEAKLPLRVRISYVKPIVNNYTYLQGSMLNLTVGFAFKSWEQKRIH